MSTCKRSTLSLQQCIRAVRKHLRLRDQPNADSDALALAPADATYARAGALVAHQRVLAVLQALRAGMGSVGMRISMHDHGGG